MKFFLNLTIVSLALLSAVNAFPHLLQKRETKFVPCDDPIGPTIPLLDVKLKPDPIESKKPATFNVSGILTKDITPDYKLQIAFYDDGYPIVDPTLFEICDKIRCPVKAGEEFKLEEIVNVPLLPDSYDFTVEILRFMDLQIEIIGCAISV